MSAVLELACAPCPHEGFTLGGTRREPRRIQLQMRNNWLHAKTHVLIGKKLLRTGEHQGHITHCTLHIHPRPEGDCCLAFPTSNTPVTHRQALILVDVLEDLGLLIEVYGKQMS